MLVYSLVGVCYGVAACLLYRYCQLHHLNTMRFAGIYALFLLGTFFIAFSCDWGYASFIEGEPQAMAIGFLVFGGFGVVCDIIAFRLLSMKPKEGHVEIGSSESVEAN